MNEIIQYTVAQVNELRIRELVKSAKLNFLEIGRLLNENLERAYWSENHESFKEFVESLGVGSYSWVTRLMDIANVVALHWLTEDEVLEIGVAKTCLLIPGIKKGKVDIDTVELAKVCPYRDLRIHLGQVEDGEMPEEYLECPRCGNRFAFRKEMIRRE